MHYTLDTPWRGLQIAVICSYLDRWSSAVGISAPFACVRKSPESLVQTAEGGARDFAFHTSSLLLDQEAKERSMYTSGTGA